MFRFTLVLYSIFLWSLSASLYSESDGTKFIQIEEPALYQAATVLGKPEEVFRGWQEEDLSYFRAKMKHVYNLLWPSSTLSNFEFRELATKQTRALVGTWGEIHLNQLMRIQKDRRPGSIYLNELEIAKLSWGSKLPDGLLYKIDNERVVIYWIAESKAGYFSQYDENQAHAVAERKKKPGYFRKWQTRGISLFDDKGQIVRFKPDQIDLFSSNKIISIVEAGPRAAEYLTFLVNGNAEHPKFYGRITKFDLFTSNSKRARQFLFLFLKNIHGRKNGNTSKDATNVVPGRDYKIQSIDINDLVNRFITANGEMPTSKNGGEDLAKTITTMGGQFTVIAKYLDLSSLGSLLKNGFAPAKSPLFNLLSQGSPYTSEGEIAIGYLTLFFMYLQSYEGEEKLLESRDNLKTIVERSLKRNSSIVESLMNEGQYLVEWQKVFTALDGESVSNFYQLNDCLAFFSQ